jgi:hypothetical protein
MHWYDPETDPSQFMAALWKVRHLCTWAEHVRMTVPGSHVLVAGDHVGGSTIMPRTRPAIANIFGASRTRRADDV